MNCKPGDIAVVVRVFVESQTKFIGAMLRVVEATTSHEGFDWFYEPLSPMAERMHRRGYTLVADCCLRPIRGEPEADSITDEQRRLMELPA